MIFDLETIVANARAQLEHSTELLRHIRVAVGNSPIKQPSNAGSGAGATETSQLAPLSNHSDLLAQTVNAQRSQLLMMAEERAQLKAQLDTISRAMGADPTRPEGYHIAVRRVLHMAAKQQAKEAAPCTT